MVAITSHRLRVTRTENPSGVRTSNRTSVSAIRAFYVGPNDRSLANAMLEHEKVSWVRPTTIRLQRRHLARDAGIQQWMRASLSGWRPGICMEILSARPRASAIGCGFVDDSAVQAERDHTIVAQLPDLSFWVPRPTACFISFRTATSAKAPGSRSDKRTQSRRSPYCARSCFVPFWSGLRCNRTRRPHLRSHER